MPSQNVRVHSGNRIDVVMDGSIIGLCQSARLADSYALEDASGIGDIHVVEHVPTKAVHTVAVTNMCLFAGAVATANFLRGDAAPLRGMNGAGYAVNGDAVMEGLVFDIVINARSVGGAGIAGEMRAAVDCSYDSGSIETSAHRIVMADASFKALDIRGVGF